MGLFAALASAFLISAAPAAATDDPLLDHDGAGNLRDYIIAYLDTHRDASFDRDPTVTVAIARTALGPNDPEGYVVYIKSRGWCGGGGCHMLIVSKVAGRFQPLGFIGAIEPTIALERPDGVGANAKLVTSTNHFSDGELSVTLTRRGDAYDSFPPYGKAQPHGKLQPLITGATPLLTLYGDPQPAAQ